MKAVSQMTFEETRNFFEELQQVVYAAFPRTLADKVLTHMCQGFFKQLQLETNCRSLDPRVTYNRVRKILDSCSEETASYILAEYDEVQKILYLEVM